MTVEGASARSKQKTVKSVWKNIGQNHNKTSNFNFVREAHADWTDEWVRKKNSTKHMQEVNSSLAHSRLRRVAK